MAHNILENYVRRHMKDTSQFYNSVLYQNGEVSLIFKDGYPLPRKPSLSEGSFTSLPFSSSASINDPASPDEYDDTPDEEFKFV